MNKYLLTNAHLIIDGQKEYLDGAILIEDEYIKEIYPQSNKLNIPQDINAYSLNGRTVLPGFFNIYSNEYIGTTNYLSTNELNDSLGLHINNINDLNEYTKAIDISFNELNNELINKLKELNIKTFITNSYEYKDIYFDSFNDMYFKMSNLNIDGSGMINKIFELNKYVTIRANKIDINLLKLTINNIKKDKLILIDDIYEGIKRLRQLNVSYTDIVNYSSLNAYRLFNLDKQYGSLIKGKKADMIIMNNDSIEYIIKKGEIKHV